MRITGGEMRGRRISPPPTRDVRPTPDAVRESLFNLLPPVSGQAFLDLYAGSGIVGFEALSRGAKCVVFVEKQAINARKIKEQVAAFGLENRSLVLTMNVNKGIAALSGREERYDIIFADPPYEREWIIKTINCCQRNDLLATGGLLVLQRSVREKIAGMEGGQGLVNVDERRYGDTVLTFLAHTFKEKG
ncbi:MAG: 16S rRNA (guanine(966)-N(2))-methyltransferase RsmD [Syntrophales bacterium]